MKNAIKQSLIILVAITVFALAISLAIHLLQNYNTNNNYNTGSDIIEVIDGDTFRMQDGEIIRLICVDTPEKNQEGYDDAVSFLGSRLLYSDAVIRLEGNKTDKYGRSLRWVYVDNVLVNREIVEYGFGSIFKYEDENCSLIYE